MSFTRSICVDQDIVYRRLYDVDKNCKIGCPMLDLNSLNSIQASLDVNLKDVNDYKIFQKYVFLWKLKNNSELYECIGTCSLSVVNNLKISSHLREKVYSSCTQWVRIISELQSNMPSFIPPLFHKVFKKHSIWHCDSKKTGKISYIRCVVTMEIRIFRQKIFDPIALY